jgi:predicted RNase H-like HicB family nuclease
MKLNFTIEIWQKGKWFLAKSPELDFISQGKTSEEAKRNLQEVIRIQFREMRAAGTLDDYLGECGFQVKKNEIVPRNEIVGFERSMVTV